MKELKAFTSIIWNFFYPLLIISSTIMIINIFKLNGEHEDFWAALILSLLLFLPYALLTFNKFLISANRYFIWENGWLIFFLMIGRYIDVNLKFGYEVWGVAFVFMKMWDSYLKIREAKQKDA